MSQRNWYFWTKLISFSMFKDGQAMIFQIWMLNSEKQLPKNCLSHSGTIEYWQSCPNPMRQANFILCGWQFFSTTPHRFRCFRKLPFKIHYKKMSATATCRIAPHRCEPTLSIPWMQYVMPCSHLKNCMVTNGLNICNISTSHLIQAKSRLHMTVNPSMNKLISIWFFLIAY